MSGKKILVIDDEESILESIQIILKEFGFECAVLNRADNIISLLSEIKPDLILLDMLLSGNDGRDVALSIKNNESTKNIPVILFSAHITGKDTYREYLADDFIEKPFEIDYLISVINKHLNLS